jgi:uncharacterized protein (DUF58 family)
MARLLRSIFWLPRVVARWFGRNQNLVFVLLALVITGTLAAVTAHWLFYRAAYVIGGLIPLCFFWARVQARGLEVEVERPEDRLQVGQETETKLRLKSRSTLTKIWLEIEDETTMPGRPSKTVITLPANGTRNWRIATRCSRRGLYTTGPVKVTTGDPFGLFKRTRSYGDRQSLLVLPKPVDLPYFWAPAAHLPGEGTVRRRTHYVTPNASGIRDYYPGDSYGRIHWRSTARLGRLMVKTFEMDPTSNVWIVLDLDQAVQAGEGDESTEEYGVTIAASVAARFLGANRMVGLIMAGREKTVVEPARGAVQYGRMMEALATAEAKGATPLATLLQEEGRKLGRHTTVIVITPSASIDWLAALSMVLQQGARAALVMLEPGSFAGGEPAELPFDLSAAAGAAVYVVPARSDISMMMGPGGFQAEGTAEPVMARAR